MLKKQKEKYTVAFWLLCAAYFALWLSQGMNGSTAAICAHRLGAGEAGRAASAALFFAGAALSRPAAGFFCDRGRSGAAVCAGAGVYLAAELAAVTAFYMWEGAAIFVVCRLFQGFGCCAAQTAMLSIAAERAPGNRTGEGVSLMGLGQALAMGMSAALALGILRLPEGEPKLYLISSACVGACLAMSAVSAAMYSKHNIYNNVSKNAFPLSLKAVPPALIQTAVGMAGVSCLSYMTVFAPERGLKAGVFFAVAAAAMLPSRFGAGKLSAKMGELTLVLPAAGAGAVGLAALPAARGAALFVLCAVLYGIGTGVAQPMLNAAAVKMGQRRGAATATFMLGADVGLMLGAAVWGGAMKDRGFGFIFIASAVLFALAGVAAAVLNKKKNPT